MKKLKELFFTKGLSLFDLIVIDVIAGFAKALWEVLR